MATEPAKYRPKTYPAPEFPPRRPAIFAKTPPAIFPVMLGLLGLVLATRAGLAWLGLPSALGDLLAGLAVPLWGFAVLAYVVKLLRRPGVILDDMKVMPARGALAAATVGGMAAAAVIAPYLPMTAQVLLFVALGLHALYTIVFVAHLFSLPAEGRAVNPGWHLVFVGFIVGGMAATGLQLNVLAQAILFAVIPIAVILWALGLNQVVTKPPPPPLRPLLAIHLAPAGLFATVASALGLTTLAMGFAGLALVILALLLARARWLTEAGFSPLWGAFAFPLTAFSGALIRLGGLWSWIGIAALGAALILVPFIAWRVLKLWAGGQLAAKTNAAEA